MTDQGKKYLSDILLSIERIELFTEEINSYNEYLDDFKAQSAVERQLGIIGEAINKFDKLFPEISLDTDRKIVGLRNRLIHSYDSIDSSIIWAVIKKHPSVLKRNVLRELK
ncbi:MAG TPA: HepT-like ribonuclease domain-containing protein [Bacteroidales bacterium]